MPRRIVEIDGEDVEYELTYKQVKNLNLRIRSDGCVTVSAPCSVPLDRIDEFVAAQGDMIKRARERIERSVPRREFYLGEGGRIPIFGREREITVTKGSRIEATLYVERLALTVPDPTSEEQIRAAIRRELSRLSEKSMPVVLEEAAKRFYEYSIPKPRLSYRCMVGKWGSCLASEAQITFNKFLICTPPECMEYVATHELAHLLVPNHSPVFHGLMDELMPDWRARKKQLEPYGYLLRLL
ncbi:MAG: M48 family metallopeptidase [Clostridia bacterium]|nr:M48 family metallopeptidase [Clostridia bacterium]